MYWHKRQPGIQNKNKFSDILKLSLLLTGALIRISQHFTYRALCVKIIDTIYITNALATPCIR